MSQLYRHNPKYYLFDHTPNYYYHITGESVPAGEQVSIKNIKQSSGANRISTKDIPITSAVPTSSAPPPSVLRELEEERGKLCQQLDEKVCMIT